MRYGFIAVIAATMACGATAGTTARDCAAEICVEQAWARATPGAAQTAAVYFSLVNNGSVADALTGVSTSLAALTMIHQTTMAENVAHMDTVDRIALPPMDRITFAPLGYHVMLMGLKTPLKEGMSVPMTLQFAKAGKLNVSVQVLGFTAAGPRAKP